jgi:hypothetical protein
VPGCTIGDASASNRNLRSARILAVSAVYLRPWALPCSRMVGRWSGTVGEAAESTTMPCYQLGPVATFDVGLICMPHLRHINGLPDPRNPLLRLDIRVTGLTGLPGVAAIPPAFASWPPHSFIHHPVSTFLPEQDRSAYQQTLGDSIANLIAPTPPGIRRSHLDSAQSPCRRCGESTSQRFVPGREWAGHIKYRRAEGRAVALVGYKSLKERASRPSAVAFAEVSSAKRFAPTLFQLPSSFRIVISAGC